MLLRVYKVNRGYSKTFSENKEDRNKRMRVESGGWEKNFFVPGAIYS